MPQYRNTVFGNRMANSWNDRVMSERLSSMVDIDCSIVNE
jgi:hypothetical protein